MKLLDLKVRNILGLREAFIVFEPGAVAIVGPNGAGKSSILDSLVLALFGSTTPVRNVNNQSIIRTGTSEGYVICTFVKDGNKYRVTRKFRAPKGQQEALLERHVDGRWQPFASTVREVNEGIVKVLSPFIGNPTDTTLSRLREAFISTVFVPQGMVTKFVDVSPGDRWQILVASLGLEGESTLQERVRRVIEDASREVENIKGHLSKISDFLEKMPPLEEINRNLVSLNNQLRGLQDELTLNEKAIETAKRLQDLQARASRYKAEIKEAKDNFERLYENLRLYDAKQALKRLVAASVNYGGLRKKIRLVENGINAIDKRVNPKLNEIELLRNNYKNLLNEIKKLNNIAKYRDLAYKYIDLHRNITKCEQDIKLLN
ncbi:MAG TPA: SMC family ATPase, partial [Acetomicrobium flavidum]|uniref:AAA family ATPase n=1 Tax=Acetomicrobium flavidum TaxID=49896 RepID=UPI002BBF1EE9|nr:SMC family ATPase [Acetomicrobium flavidum]